MWQEQNNNMRCEPPQICIIEVQQKGLNNWETVLEANSQQITEQNQTAPVFSSEGKWSFEIKRKELSAIDDPVIQLIKEDFGLDDSDLEIQEKPEIKNIRQALILIGIKFEGISEAGWRQNYGFWEFNDFRIDVKDGNTTIFDFKNESYHFVFFHEASLKSHTFANQNK